MMVMDILKVKVNGEWIGIPAIVGESGTTFTPSVSSEGVLSWSNTDGKTNPASVDIAGAVRDVFVVNISETAPSIIAAANTRYICGEISTLSITPPSSGICDVIFTSGSSATIVTLPSTVMMPEWFSVESNRIYEISIEDGVRGVVTSWPVS